MKNNLTNIIDFERVNILLEGFNKTTGFVTAILDLEGNVLSQSGWRQICTEFHRINKETAANCRVSDTVLAGELAKGEKFHFYQCLNGLVDVAVPIVINGEHLANLFSGQFFFEEPNRGYFIKQAEKYGFNKKEYLGYLDQVPVVPKEKVITAMEFLHSMVELIVEMAGQQHTLTQLNNTLQENEEKYRLLHEAAGVGIGYYTPGGVVISYNNLAARNMNGKPEDFAGKSIFELFPKEAAEEYAARIKKALKSELPQEYEDKVVLPSSVFWFNSVYTRIVDSNKEISGVQIISTDITERKRTEEEKQKFIMLAESSSEFIGMCDLDLKPLYVNPAGIKMVGLPDMEAACRVSVQDYFYPEDQDFISNDFFPRVMREGHGEVEIRLRHFQTGNPIWMSYYLYHVRDAGGNLVGWATVSRDITGRKQSEMQLKESEQRFAKIFNNSPIGVNLVKLGDSTVVDINDAYLEIIGYSKEEVIGKTAKELNLFVDFELRERLLQELWETGRLINKLAQFRSKSGETKIVLASVELIEIGGELMSLNAAIDITEKIKAEEKIREKNEELQTLNRIILKTTENLNLQMRLEFIMDEALSITGLEGGTICLINPDNTFKLAVHRETSEETINDLTNNKIKVGDCLCGNCALEHKPLILHSPGEILKYATREVLRGEDIRFHAAFPFVIEGKSLGVLCVFTRTDKKPSEDSLRLIEIICAQSSVVIKNAQIFDELQDSEERLRLSTENANIAVWENNLAFNTLIRSKNLDRLFGLEWQDTWDRNRYVQATHPDDRKYATANMLKTIPKGGEDFFKYEFRVIWPDSSVRWLMNDGRIALRNEAGQGVLARGTIIDITDLKNAEQEIIKLNEELELKVRERTLELNQKMAKIEKMNKLFVGRELRMKELKHKISLLEDKIQLLEEKQR